MILAALLAAAVVKAIPLEVRVPDRATWTITAERLSEVQRDGKTTTWTLRTEKQLAYRQGGFRGAAELTITPLKAEAGGEAPPDLVKREVFPQPVTVEVRDSLEPLRFVDEKAVRRAFSELGLGEPKSKPWEDKPSPMVMAGREVAMAARGQAFPLAPGRPFEFNQDVPSPFILPVRTSVRYLLESYDPAAGRAVITWRRSADETAYKAAADRMLAFARKAKPGEEPAALTELSRMSFSRDETCRFDLDLRTGLAVKTTCENGFTHASGGLPATSTERWVITQTLPEAR